MFFANMIISHTKNLYVGRVNVLGDLLGGWQTKFTHRMIFLVRQDARSVGARPRSRHKVWFAAT